MREQVAPSEDRAVAATADPLPRQSANDPLTAVSVLRAAPPAP